MKKIDERGKYKIYTEELIIRTYEVSGNTFRDAALKLHNILKEETIFTRNPKLNPIKEYKIKERFHRKYK